MLLGVLKRDESGNAVDDAMELAEAGFVYCRVGVALGLAAAARMGYPN